MILTLRKYALYKRPGGWETKREEIIQGNTCTLKNKITSDFSFTLKRQQADAVGKRAVYDDVKGVYLMYHLMYRFDDLENSWVVEISK